MKKVFVLTTVAFLVTGFAFAQEGGKKSGTGKSCCKDSKECKKDEKKDGKTAKATVKATTKPATKA